MEAMDESEGTAHSMNEVEETDEGRALLLMREKLPTYVVDSFVAAGFDTLEVISEIDINNNGLDEIEQYITNECKEDDRFKQWFGVSGNFKFLPGHCRRIVNFINKS